MSDREAKDPLGLARLKVRAARRTVLIFLVFGLVWIVVTDYIARALFFAHSETWNTIQTMKGTIFVILASLVIYFSIIRYAERVLEAEIDSRNRLRYTELEFRTMVETMGEGVCALDREDHIIYANHRFREIVGRDLPELIGAPIFEVLPPLEGVQTHDLSGQSETRIQLDGRGTRLISINAVPRIDSEGVNVGKLCVFNDLTERRQSEIEKERLHAQLDQMTRIESLGKLAGTMAHEFNNVMAGILPFTEVIDRLAPPDERILSATGYIRESVSRGRRVSQEVLRFARPMPLSRTRIDVADLLSRAERLGRSIVRNEHDLEISETLAFDESLDIDVEQIEQVFTNLLINARDAMSERGTMAISATCDQLESTYAFAVVEHPDRFIHFAVSDNGNGIPESVLATVFEPLVTTKRRGTGLGLAISYQIVTSHGGLIFAESTEGEGTVIHMFLPLARWGGDEPPRHPERV